VSPDCCAAGKAGVISTARVRIQARTRIEGNAATGFGLNVFRVLGLRAGTRGAYHSCNSRWGETMGLAEGSRDLKTTADGDESDRRARRVYPDLRRAAPLWDLAGLGGGGEGAVERFLDEDAKAIRTGGNLQLHHAVDAGF